MTGFAIVDVETTGLFPGAHDRVVEIAIVRTDSLGQPLDEFCTLVNPQRDVGATHVHGIRARDLSNAPTFADVAGDIIERLKGAVFVAHNATFDFHFLESEFARIGVEMPEIPLVCTMRLPRRCFPSVRVRKLGEVCAALGIEHKGAHSAEGDAEATAGILKCCLDRLRDEGHCDPLSCLGIQEELPGPDAWPDIPPSCRTLSRSEARAACAQERCYIKGLVERLPDRCCNEQNVDAYLALLDRALEDRIVTADEAESLLKLALDLGLSREQAVDANKAYLRSLAVVAWEDGIITDPEREDLLEVQRLLGLADGSVEIALAQAERDRGPEEEAKAPPSEDVSGATVCFTGELCCCIDGVRATRARAESIASDHGMLVRKSVSKKLRYLVAADPHSLSTKARKAHEYGVRVIAEAVFWRMVGIQPE